MRLPRLWTTKRTKLKQVEKRTITILGKLKLVTNSYSTSKKCYRYVWLASPKPEWECMFSAIPDPSFNCWRVYANFFGMTLQGDFYPRRKRKCPPAPKKS